MLTKDKGVLVRVTFTEEALGTGSANPALYKEFIESNRPEGAPVEDEAGAIPTVPEELQKATTVFPRMVNATGVEVPFIYDYQVKGFFKDAAGMLGRTKSKEDKMKAYKKVIDGLIFPKPRKIELHIPDGMSMGICERPLRAQTPQGERVCLARSESVPAGTWMEFTVLCLDPKNYDDVEVWLEYGALRGMMQWRNGGKGTISYTLAVIA